MSELITCGFMDHRPMVKLIAGVPVCAVCLAKIANIQAGHVNYRRPERTRVPEHRRGATITVTCLCGVAFSYKKVPGAVPQWCPSCRYKSKAYRAALAHRASA